VNRRLAALRRFFQWAKGQGLARELATDNVKGVASAPRAPHWLEKREVDRLIRTVERHGNARDLAIVLTLRHTGIRVSELCSLELSDVEISERKGSLTVRSGKGGKFRVLPLNVDARRAIASYLDVRPKVAAATVFIGQRGQGVSARAVQLVITKYGRLAGLEEVTPTPSATASASMRSMLEPTWSAWPRCWAISGSTRQRSTPRRVNAIWSGWWRA
jgi:site-specific recombinase XerD